MSQALDPVVHSTALLREAASGRAGPAVEARLAQVQAVLGDDLLAVDRELARAVRVGPAPAIEAATHLLDAGGKRVRPLTVMLSSACFGAVPPAARELAVVAELVHLATLLHDDVVDDGSERRGTPTARRVWGNAVSVLAGDLLLTHALERTAAVAPPPVLASLFSTLRRLVDGEVVQLRGRTALDPSEETYFRIVRDKTASLFAWSARAGAMIAGAPAEAAEALADFGAHVGLAFQLVDDVLDYAGDAAETGKGLHADLAEGKLTLPLLRAIAARPTLLESVEAIRAGRLEGSTALAQAVRASGACDSVRALARTETDRALRALEAVPPSGARSLLAAIASELAARVR